MPHPPPSLWFCPPPHPETAWPQAQTPIQAGGRGKCTMLCPFSEKLRVPGIPVPVPPWPEHRPNSKELERSSSKWRGALGTQMTFDSAFRLPHFTQDFHIHTGKAVALRPSTSAVLGITQPSVTRIPTGATGREGLGIHPTLSLTQ